jgi:hypothetical protein
MSRWNTLFDEYRTHEAERLEADRRARQLEAERRDLERWCAGAVKQVIAQIAEQAARRSDELALHAGVRVEVQAPRSAPARSPGAEVTYIGLKRGSDVVYVYAYLEKGYLPLVHFMLPAYDGYLERPRHPRLISLPGCRLVREGADGVRLERIRIDGSLASDATTSADDLVYRAFELLLRGGCAKRSADVELSPPPIPQARARA